MRVRTYRGQKAGLTRVTNKLRDAERHKRDAGGRDRNLHDERVREAADKVRIECVRTVKDWRGLDHGWPDDWHRWNIALGDAFSAYRRADGDHPYFPSHLDDIR